jgi:hypothetical protein
MRLGKVTIGHSYVVDLDNQEMVDEAKDCLAEDMMNAVKYNEIGANLHVDPAPDADPGDIPDFLMEGADGFTCEGCSTVQDIEDSIRDEESKELFCEDCARKRGLVKDEVEGS